MKKILAILCTVALIFALCACGSSSAPAAPAAPAENSGSAASAPAEAAPAPAPAEAAPAFDGTVTIGHIAPMTGDNAMNGEYSYNALLMAVDEINAAGGILGKEVKVELYDELSSAEGSTSAYASLAENKDIVAVVGTNMSVYTIACDELIKNAGIPYISCGSSSNVNNLNNPYIWQVRPLDTFQGQGLAAVAADRFEAKNVAFLYSTDSTYYNLMDKTSQALRETYGYEIPDSAFFAVSESESNFSSYIASLMDGGYDLIFVFAGNTPTALIMQQSASAGLEAICIGASGVADSATLDIAGTDGDGWYSVSDWVSTATTARASEFSAKYKAAHGSMPATAAAFAYDSMYLIKQAMETAGTTTDRDAINEAFAKTSDFEGVAGVYSYFDTDRSLAKGMFISVVEDAVAQYFDSIIFR